MDCGVELAGWLTAKAMKKRINPGDHIGLIYSPLTGGVAYHAGEHDSNKRCVQSRMTITKTG
jgi:hypothetical protein